MVDHTPPSTDELVARLAEIEARHGERIFAGRTFSDEEAWKCHEDRHDLLNALVALQSELAEAVELLRPFVAFAGDDCGDAACEDCAPYRPVRAFIARHAKPGVE